MKKITTLLKHPVTYAILLDVFLMSLFVLMGFVLSEVFLPGIVSVYISPFTLFAIITALFFAIIAIAHIQNISFEKTPTKKTLPFLVSIGLFGGIVVIAGYRYGLTLGVITAFLSMMILILLYRSYQKKFL
jgi:hypothetical protein